MKPRFLTNSRIAGSLALALSCVAPGLAQGVDPSTLPYELRTISQRYPVTLYTGSECAPCQQGRQMLMKRGIPFAEKTVSASADIQQLQKLTGQRQLPVLTIGKQHLFGFSSAEWSQYLDVAGYPESSRLPSNWKQPAAQALAPSNQNPAAGTNATINPERPERAAPSVAPPITPENPAGLRF